MDHHVDPNPAHERPHVSSPDQTGEQQDQGYGIEGLPQGDDALALLSTPLHGLRDQFLEQRHHNCAQLDLSLLADNGVVAFLSKVHQMDELYEVPTGTPIAGGTYRIRDEGASAPFVTLKRHGDGHSDYSETIDIVDPEEGFVGKIRKYGKLIAVIEKTRATYKSKEHENCLIHCDAVNGLGYFFDVKADTPQAMDSFTEALGLSSSTHVGMSYLEMKQEQGISDRQLSVWKFHQRFQDYVLGVVSGTLTPLSFLTATAATGASDEMLVVSLAVAGIGDGISDAVAASQTVQSKSGATTVEQFQVFAKTMLGKAVIPLTFLPSVLATSSELATIGTAAGWSLVLLASTATIQAIAHDRPVLPAIGRLAGFGGLAVGAGVAIGEVVPWLIGNII